MTNIEKNKAGALRFLEALGRCDAAGMVEAMADDGIAQTMGNTPISETRTRAQILAGAPLILSALPHGLEMKIHTVIAEGDSVAVEAESIGLHVSGKTYNNKYHWLFRMRDGKVALAREYMDTQHVADVFCGDKAATKT
jgi:ketosteroid isomerase-like protein